MVRRGDDRERHRNRQRDGHEAQREARHGHQEHDPDEEVPAGVQARQRRVLIRQARRLERAVGVGALRDRVDQPDVEQPRRRDGEQRKEEEADQAGGDHRVAQEVVVPAPVEVETGRDAEDDWPVAPDIDPVGDVHERVAAERHRLHAILPGDPERVLEGDQTARVGERCVGAPRREVAHAEIDEDRARDDQSLTGEPSRHGDGSPPRRRGHTDRESWREDRPHPHLLARVSSGRCRAASAISRSRRP